MGPEGATKLSSREAEKLPLMPPMTDTDPMLVAEIPCVKMTVSAEQSRV